MSRKWKTTQILIQTLWRLTSQQMERHLKNRHLRRHSSPRVDTCSGLHPTQDRGSRTRVENIIKMTPGPTRYATSRVDDIKSSFQLFLPESIEEIILEMTNLEGKRVFRDTWREIDLVDLQAYILAGVYRSNNEATKSLWDAESGRPIFRATMSLQQFHVLSRIIRFDNRDTRPVQAPAPAPAAALATLPQQGHGQKRKHCELCAPRAGVANLIRKGPVYMQVFAATP